eukprot:CAMPEP_0113320976 /NCGR_PEP_ID=MMETSP0010_2-20120614/14615_1 /TAXON_ID=216773 ORGANISM="Corethron hystrix, Strain 308" /NCGR_SAMPLE_ID=MMETSP0010_2 /ASSEMBLY_ACC=CAM_ASM_000155 /LENGTH=234 /DNA_ID=CAMNT_0000178957 /DNA_START=738 /DNA_END=1442 /DNA_ORIENTATION=- /assembly_acc=CAM_ASM_000155
MKWPQDLVTKFPYNQPCSKGCPARFSIENTLRYRETFKPWLLTQAMIDESRDGWFYIRGVTKEGNPIVWYRVGKHSIDDPDSYIRVLFYNLEKATAESMKSSNGKDSGKYSIFIDVADFSTSKLPSFQYVKKIFALMQDHLPNRLKAITILNLSTPAQLFYNLCKPLLHEDVQRKISVPPKKEKLRLMEMQKLVQNEYIPTWLGGKDAFVFSSDSYYGLPTASNQEVLPVLNAG